MTAAFDRAKILNSAGQSGVSVILQLVNCSRIPADEQIPSLSSKPGPDGGINGQWDLSGAASPIDSPFTRKGWNISFEPESP
jgi:hypothetical protein